MTHINLSMRNLTTLEGLEWPSNIIRPASLDCGSNRLTSLKGCPDWIDRLNCCGNQITSLKGCPKILEILSCADNRLTSLEGCPQKLEILSCADNRLTSLKDCPQGLKELYCSYNQLTSLEGCPQGLKALYCGNNQLTSFSLLPTSIESLNCNNNPLEPFWRGKKLEEIHKIRYLKCLTHLGELVATIKMQRFWRRQYYDIPDKDGYSRYAKFVFREEKDIIRDK